MGIWGEKVGKKFKKNFIKTKEGREIVLDAKRLKE